MELLRNTEPPPPPSETTPRLTPASGDTRRPGGPLGEAGGSMQEAGDREGGEKIIVLTEDLVYLDIGDIRSDYYTHSFIHYRGGRRSFRG